MQCWNKFGVSWYKEHVQVLEKLDWVKSTWSVIEKTSNCVDVIIWWWLLETSLLNLSKLNWEREDFKRKLIITLRIF